MCSSASELCRDLPWPISVDSLQPVADSPVDRCALGGGEPFVEDLSVEIVEEAVVRGRSAVRRRLVAGSLEEASDARERVTPLVHVSLAPLACGRGRFDRKLLTDRTRHCQELTVGTIELLLHLLDQLTHRVRHVAREGLDVEILAAQ